MGLLGLTGTRGGISWSPTAAELDDYLVKRSVRFNDDDSSYLNRTFSQGNQQTWTYSCWLKRASLGATKFALFGQGSGASIIFDDSYGGDRIRYVHSGAGISKWSKVLYRDPSAWYHIVVVLDTNNGTQEDRLRFYINGERVTDWHTNTLTDLTPGVVLGINSANAHDIGRFNGGSYFDGLISEVNFVDGAALDATSFGETNATTGQWVPKRYTHSTSDWHTVNDGTTWSDSTNSSLTHSGGPAAIFDGSLITAGGHPSGSDLNTYVTLTDGVSISASTGIRIYWNGTASGQRYIKINDTTIVSNGSLQLTPGWSPVSSFSGTINKIEVETAASGSWSLSAIEIDGHILVDDAVDNSFHLAMDPAESGTIYSAADIGTFGDASIPDSVAYNGDVTYNGSPTILPANNDVTIFEGSLVTSTNISVNTWFSGNGNANITINGSAGQTVTNYNSLSESSNGWHDIAYVGTITSITMKIASNQTRFVGLKADGKLLVDHTVIGHDSSGQNNDWYENNLVAASNEVTVSAATDGLPFYNTTGDYGGTKGSGYRTDSSAGTTDGTGLVLALPGDVLTDEHDEVNTGSSAHTIAVNGTVTSTSGSKFYGTSLEFDGSNDYLVTPVSTDFEFGSGDFTLECWIKPDADDNGPSPVVMGNGSDSNSCILLYSYSAASTGFGCYLSSNGSSWNMNTFKGTGGYTVGEWMHYALTRDGNTFRLFSNGVLKETWTASGSLYGNTNQLSIGGPRGSKYWAGNIQDLRVYKGVAKYTSDFTVPTRQTNATDIDLLADTPGAPYDNSLNGGGNYCTWNTLDKSSDQVLFNGALDVGASGDGWKQVKGTIGINSGKYYWEITCISSTRNNAIIGISDDTESLATHPGGGSGYGYGSGGSTYHAGSVTSAGNAYGDGDVIGVAVDCDGGTIKYYINNSLQTTSNISTTTTWRPAIGVYYSDGSIPKYATNFGQRAFDNLPTGYKSLNTFNLDAPSIVDPSEHFDIRLWQGNDGTTTIDDMGFSPDLMWIKNRDNTNPYHHALYDTIRGKTAMLSSSENADEETNYGDVESQTTGFEIDGAESRVNENPDKYVGWLWDAGSPATPSSYNQSSIWSDDVTGTPYSSTYSVDKAFDGDSSSFAQSTYPGTLTWTPSGGHAFSSSLQIEATIYGTSTPTVTVVHAGGSTDITSQFSTGATSGPTLITGITSPITSIAWASTDGSNYAGIHRIIIDDKILVNTRNQSAIWSDGKSAQTNSPSYQIEQLFDGSLSTYGMVANSNGDSTIVVNLPGLSSGKTVRFYGFKAVNAGTLTFNGGTVSLTGTSSGSAAWVTAGNTTNGSSDSFTMNVTSSNTQDAIGIYAVEVDGKLLVDAGYIPAGSANNSAYEEIYDQSYTWSSTFVSASGSWWSGYDNTKAFDGDPINTESGTNASSVACTFTIPVGYRGTNRVWMVKVTDKDQISVDGSVVRNEDAGRGSADNWYTLASTNPTSIAIYSTTTSSNLRGVKADGKLLVDNDVTPPNVPSIPSIVKASPSTGFSIASFSGTGSTGNVAHGLNSQPSFIVVKRRNGANDWETYHKEAGATGIGATHYAKLNETDPFTTAGSTSRWNDTSPTSSVFTVGTSSNVNDSSGTYIAYCWSEVAGYSRISSYTGNTSDYPFVWCGFKPAFIMVKSAALGNWIIFDNKRDPYNTGETTKLAPNLEYEENNNANIGAPSQSTLDFLSNGFKITSTGGTVNDNGVQYLFMAFAESPFHYSNAI